MSNKQSPHNRAKAASPDQERLGHPDLLGRELSNAVVFFHEAIASYLGISAAEWKCLGLLGQHGPSTAGRLAELSGFTTGAITGIVDLLEKAGYLRREPHPTDRRSVIIHPLRLKEVQQRVKPIFQSLSTAMAAQSRRYSAAQLAAIAQYLRETTALLHRETTRLRSAKKTRAKRPALSGYHGRERPYQSSS